MTGLREVVLDEKAIIERIGRIRNNKNITLKALAAKTGLTEGYLSRITNATSAPPISTLTRIAQGLGIDVSYLLLGGNGAEEENPSIMINRKEESNDSATSEAFSSPSLHRYHFKPLSSLKRGKSMQPHILTPDFDPGEFLQHEGEEFLYILEGTIEFLYGAERYELNQGDSAYFDSHIPHTGRSLGGNKAKVLIVLYPYRRR